MHGMLYEMSIDIAAPLVTLSSKFQLVIPEKVRTSMKLQPGVKFQVLQYDGRIELIPVRPMAEMRGFLGSIDTEILRDEEERV